MADRIADNNKLLEVEGLVKRFPVKGALGKNRGWLTAVDGVSFGVARGSVFALVGESGCGKSTVAKLIMRLLEPTAGSITVNGTDIAQLEGAELRSFRKSAQIIFQDPFASLNPRMRIMDALAEPYIIHKLVPRAEIRERVTGLIKKVGLSEDALMKYPHEFSGGQRQRICIARALSVSPELIVADEPLSALDVSIQAQILNLLEEIRRETGISIVFISHDLRVVRYMSDEIAIMYLGRIVETGSTEEIFANPLHPYTNLLLSSAPRLRRDGSRAAEARSESEPGAGELLAGCAFYPRCPKRSERCNRELPELKVAGRSRVACHLY